MSQKTYVPSEDDLERRWVLFDARDRTLGRLVTRVARVLRGKHKRTFTPHLDGGDGAIVVNASGIRLTGNKDEQKQLVTHSGYIGGLKSEAYGELLETEPRTVLERAVRGMLPKNRLGRKMLKHLRVYADADHPHEAQDPVEYDWDADRVPPAD